jgi:hypothetical protein
MWDVSQTTDFEAWWSELSEQEQDDVTAIVELLEEMGYDKHLHTLQSQSEP